MVEKSACMSSIIDVGVQDCFAIFQTGAGGLSKIVGVTSLGCSVYFLLYPLGYE